MTSVRKGRCNAEGMFPATIVGMVAVYQYPKHGDYMGTLHHACVLSDRTENSRVQRVHARLWNQ